MAVCVVLFSVSMPHAATTITSSKSVKGSTVRMMAIAKGDARSASLPCADASSRQCESNCKDGICTVAAGWGNINGGTSSAGSYSFNAGTMPTPNASAHQWCIRLLNSMGAPLGSGGGNKSTIRSVTINGQANINGFSCPSALEPDVFEP